MKYLYSFVQRSFDVAKELMDVSELRLVKPVHIYCYPKDGASSFATPWFQNYSLLRYGLSAREENCLDSTS
jgi:hypothetical protein